MRRILRILLLIILSQSISAMADVRLKALLIGDTNDRTIGESVSADIASYKKMMSDIRDALAVKDVSCDVDIYTGNNCSYEKLNAYLNDLRCDGDVILVIYNGHGARSHEDNSKFPRMCLGSDYIQKWMKVSELMASLRAKNPRLVVVITDCCNSYFDRSLGYNEKGFGIFTSHGNGDGFRKLFLNYKGEVCLCGASPGEYGWALQQGGMLSLNMMQVMYMYDAKGDAASWDNVMRDISDRTYDVSKRYYNQRSISKTQRPVYDVNVSEVKYSRTESNYDVDTDKVTHINIPNHNEIEVNHDGPDLEDDELYEDVDDELYEDEEGDERVGSSLLNSVMISLIGLALLYLPKWLDLSGGNKTVCNVLGTIAIIWAIIAFFINL